MTGYECDEGNRDLREGGGCSERYNDMQLHDGYW